MSTKLLKRHYRDFPPRSGGGLRMMASAYALAGGPLQESAKLWCERKGIEPTADNGALRLARELGYDG